MCVAVIRTEPPIVAPEDFRTPLIVSVPAFASILIVPPRPALALVCINEFVKLMLAEYEPI